MNQNTISCKMLIINIETLDLHASILNPSGKLRASYWSDKYNNL